MASNFDIRCDGENWSDWNWLRSPVVEVITQVEMWDVLVRLITLVKKNNLIEIRAYFPVKNNVRGLFPVKNNVRGLDFDEAVPKFESSGWCFECRKKTRHDLDTCRVIDIMES